MSSIPMMVETRKILKEAVELSDPRSSSPEPLCPAAGDEAPAVSISQPDPLRRLHVLYPTRLLAISWTTFERRGGRQGWKTEGDIEDRQVCNDCG
jgi:hypothetical protein